MPLSEYGAAVHANSLELEQKVTPKGFSFEDLAAEHSRASPVLEPLTITAGQASRAGHVFPDASAENGAAVDKNSQKLPNALTTADQLTAAIMKVIENAKTLPTVEARMLHIARQIHQAAPGSIDAYLELQAFLSANAPSHASLVHQPLTVTHGHASIVLLDVIADHGAAVDSNFQELASKIAPKGFNSQDLEAEPSHASPMLELETISVGKASQTGHASPVLPHAIAESGPALDLYSQELATAGHMQQDKRRQRKRKTHGS